MNTITVFPEKAMKLLTDGYVTSRACPYSKQPQYFCQFYLIDFLPYQQDLIAKP